MELKLKQAVADNRKSRGSVIPYLSSDCRIARNLGFNQASIVHCCYCLIDDSIHDSSLRCRATTAVNLQSKLFIKVMNSLNDTKIIYFLTLPLTTVYGLKVCTYVWEHDTYTNLKGCCWE